MVAMLQMALVCLLFGSSKAAGHVLLIALVMGLCSPWFWASLLGLAALPPSDDR